MPEAGSLFSEPPNIRPPMANLLIARNILKEAIDPRHLRILNMLGAPPPILGTISSEQALGPLTVTTNHALD